MNRLLALLTLALAVTACGSREDHTAAGLYKGSCARCHGIDGKGDRRSVNLYPRLDLTTSPLIQKRARGAVYQRISEGYGPMPGFAHRFDQDEIGSLVDFTLRFAQQKAGR
ncbi:MAG: cytochrome c [Acidobacteriota bacterium]|nr:cytochrome c [Acidobacteriota bacterium]